MKCMIVERCLDVLSVVCLIWDMLKCCMLKREIRRSYMQLVGDSASIPVAQVIHSE